MLRECREAAGLTQQELADRSGVSRKTINNLETGRHLSQNGTLLKLAKALGISPSVIAPSIDESGGVFWQVKQEGCLTRSEPYYPDEGWAE